MRGLDQKKRGITMSDDIEYLGVLEIPTWALSALTNGDESGLSDEEAEAIGNWLDGLGHECLSYNEVYDEHPEFSINPEFGFPCEVTLTGVHGSLKEAEVTDERGTKNQRTKRSLSRSHPDGDPGAGSGYPSV